MNEKESAARPKRSKVMRFILVAIALAYFWASQYTLWYGEGKII